MIDGVRLTTRVNDPARIAACISGAPFDPASGRALTGRLGTLWASICYDELRLRGSLPTFMGETAPLSRAGVERARARIEDALCICMGDARVTGLEVTADLTLPSPPAHYLALLGCCSRTQRVEYQGESVSFRTDARWFTFYDKTAEREKRKKPSPKGHVIRAEVKYRKRVRHKLGADGPVTLADLHAPSFLRHLVGSWQREYDRVEKRHPPAPLSVGKDFRRSLMLAGVSSLGARSIEAQLRAAEKSGTIHRSTMNGRILLIRGLATDPALTTESPLVSELDAAVRDAVERALANLDASEKKDSLLHTARA